MSTSRIVATALWLGVIVTMGQFAASSTLTPEVTRTTDGARGASASAVIDSVHAHGATDTPWHALSLGDIEIEIDVETVDDENEDPVASHPGRARGVAFGPSAPANVVAALWAHAQPMGPATRTPRTSQGPPLSSVRA